jgi:GT2 family glycosyltransferase
VSRVAVVIPTRNRPEQLARCLGALAAAREQLPCPVYVGDSSTTPELRAAVDTVCAEHDGVHVRRHALDGYAAARNHVTRACDGAELLISVDDDVYVEPGALAALVAAYDANADAPWRFVAGTVRWPHGWSEPVHMRPIGYGREVRAGEEGDFVVSALLLYPRELAERLPWPEAISSSEDRFAGYLWRGAGARMVFAPEARATHDEHTGGNSLDVAHMADHVYANLFDAAYAHPRPARVLSYELLGVAFGLKQHRATPWAFARAWARGNRRFVRDRRRLRALARTELPAAGPSRQ